MSAPLVSVIILNYNGERQLGSILDGCILSTLKTDYPNFEVLVVDNASTDGSVEYIKNAFGGDSKLRIICNEKNLGFSEGNNRGIKQAKGELVALLNSDTRVEPSWLRSLVAAAEPPDVGAVQSKLVQMGNPELLDCAGGLLDFYGYHFERGRGEQASKYGKAGEVFYGKGASLLLKRSALQTSGLFDPEIFLYFDEVDLCWRIWLSGHRVLYAPDSVVYHASGSTAATLQSASRFYYYTRNHLTVLLKNYNLKNAAFAVKASLLFEARNIARALVRHEPVVALAILKGLLWNLFQMRHVWGERQTVQKRVRRVSDGEIRRHMLAPYPPFPVYILFSRARYREKAAAN
jgi:GT2 family glycosyltransferase